MGLGLQDAAPDHSTISRFRTQLARAGVAERLFAAVEEKLAGRGVLVKQGTLVDATLVDVQVRRPKGAATERAARAIRTRPGPGGAGRPASATSCTWAWTPSRSWSGARR